jgi:transcription antitermination factor NusG
MECQASPSFHTVEAGALLGKPQWYVTYTYPRHEKAVADQLQLRLVETFLPTYKHISAWKDRRVKLDLPLFAGYVFTRLPVQERLKVISAPGVIRMLCYRGAPVAVSDAEIDAIRRCVGSGAKLEPHAYIALGDRVRVREGMFEGLSGIVVRENNKCKLVVNIELIHQSVSLEIDPNCLELVNPANMRGRVAMHGSNTRRGCAGVVR